MSTVYSPVLHVGSREWVFGKIEDHVARPLSKEEIEEVITILAVIAGPSRRTSIELIERERYAQWQREGFSTGHDDEHDEGELARAAACYALPVFHRGMKSWTGTMLGSLWPFEGKWWKPTPDDRVRELVKAGALISAEIDRLLREKGGAT